MEFLGPLTGGGTRPGTWTSTAGSGSPAGQEAPSIVILRWPKDAEMLDILGRHRRPRLLLVDPDSEAPLVTDLLEDWIRLPADEQDIETRLESLRWRVGHHQAPVFDGVCRVGFRGGWAALSPMEYSLASVLVERFGYLVNDTDLRDRTWGDSPPSPTSLSVHLTRLRRRVNPIGLEILTIRSRGHVMQAAGAALPTSGLWPAPGH